WDHLETLVVDVGGGSGNLARILTSSTNHISSFVQDHAHVIAHGAGMVPAELQSRIEFQAHDFLERQPTTGVDVFVFARIFLNWSDKYCVQILRALDPAMKTGARC
ncbi:S-adenosyl-L-methionine-dependent methyltransferase, partial [Paraphaeosphaeria sporulosa]